MKFSSKIALVFIVLLFAVSAAFPAGLIAPKQSYAGASLGLWYGVGLSVGYEKILQEMPELQGYLGVGGEIGYASQKDTWYGDTGWKYTYVPFFVFASYHYKMEGKLDPYVRFGLGYVYVNSSWYGTEDWGWYGGKPSASSSYVGVSGQVGVRYAINPKMFVRAALGTPWIASLGIDFKLD
jgi:hypothetical protein